MATEWSAQRESAAEFDDLWELIFQGSEEQALVLGFPSTIPRIAAALQALDEWLSDQGADAALDDEAVTRLGLFLARLLLDNHGGGLTRIDAPGHPLHDEWALTGFTRGLAADYHVPFLVSAVRLGGDRSLSATAWYQQLLAEGADNR